MARLTARELRGIWGGVTLSWDESYGFDEKTYAKNIARTISARVHGIYTTGSTGEFYALEDGEFRRMVDIQAELCGKARMPLQIGCNADSTARTIRLMEYATGKAAVGAVQVVVPYWMEVNDRELLQFFKDLSTACPDIPLVHYNVPRAKRFLLGQDYLKILEVAPNLIGVKFTYAGSHFEQLQHAMLLTPGLSYFVGENLLASAMQLGARGCYSSLVFTDPAFVLKLYDMAEAGRWAEAVAMQQRICRFLHDLDPVVAKLGEGEMDPVIDKALAVASGFFIGSQRCRPPYIGFSDESVRSLRAWMEKEYPEFVYHAR